MEIPDAVWIGAILLEAFAALAFRSRYKKADKLAKDSLAQMLSEQMRIKRYEEALKMITDADSISDAHFISAAAQQEGARH